ncbi:MULTISPECIES: polysaccharide deacetylase [unclassified Streptomyces]|uniref:polysaccharide deacetylase n=2 Tax=Streptomyces TaxID=1883 RepID=UPI00225B40FA|nr:polysaccharide deacetylase [Streptomyces sp. NBC_01551]
MKKSMSKAAGAVLGLALAGVLGATGVAQAQVQPSAPAPAPAGGKTIAGASAVQAPASVIAEVEAATARQRTLAPSARVVCYSAHVQDIGWQSAVCDGQIAGTTGQSRRMEAVVIATRGVGGICANAHLADVGWQGWACAGEGAAVTVGTTGQSRRMEALGLQVGSGAVAAQAHVADHGWLISAAGNPVYVGTTGQSRRMEAVRIWV